MMAGEREVVRDVGEGRVGKVRGERPSGKFQRDNYFNLVLFNFTSQLYFYWSVVF
jgi:hypothetical protein